MTSPVDSPSIHAFIDGELDLSSRLEIEARLADDTALRAQVDGLRALRDAIREQADYHPAPDALRQRMAALARPAPIAPRPRQWFRWRPRAGSVAGSLAMAAAMTLALHLTLLRPSPDDRLLDEVVASHVRSTLGEHLVDVASSDHHTVKPWLSSRLDFSPPVHELPLPGSVFVGGRLDYLDGRPVAALVYRQGQHLVNAFVWRDSGGDSAPRFVVARGYQVAGWSRAGMVHWVISDLDPREFRKVVAAIEAAGG
jgi:anti-sigma factor RsiW